MGLKTPSIYKYFGTYTKEQINQMILKLSEEERAQLTLKYGDDLENPVRNPNWNQKLNAKFYRTLIPKMKSLLDNLVDKQERKQSHDASILEKEDYIKMLEMLRTPSFEQLMTSLSPKEAIVISLRLGYVDEKYFSTESISNFLGIEQEEVREITKKVLLTYKENINQFIDKAIGNVTDKPVILNKK